MVDDKGQIHTIEGFTAAFILILAMLYGVQSVAITPTSSSTASQEVELNNYKLTDDILSASNSNGELREAILNWNASAGQFIDSQQEENFYSGTTEGTFEFGAPVPGDLGDTLNESLTQRGLAYNIDLSCADDNSGMRFAENGDPSNHASTATTLVTLQEYDRVESENGSVTLAEVSNNGDLSYFCSKSDATAGAASTNMYNVVEVKITVWRM